MYLKKKIFEKKYSASIAMKIILRQLPYKINLRQLTCTKSASNAMHKKCVKCHTQKVRQMPCTKSVTKKTVKMALKNCKNGAKKLQTLKAIIKSDLQNMRIVF